MQNNPILRKPCIHRSRMDSIVYTCYTVLYDRDQNVVKKHIAASVCAEMKYVGVTRTTRVAFLRFISIY